MTIVIWTCCVVIALSLTSRAEASEDSVYTSFFSNDAAGGYDVTAYFDKGAPEKGDSRFMTAYNGADWLFSSQENLDKFVANPEKYAPQYGGYCAWAVAKGELYKGDPLHWSVVDGKLYLNYDQSVQDRWLKDVPGFISSADSRWPTVLN
ncbi:MAG: YHS domain-containing (seleno)protein [Pseudomonadota bacterium]